MISAAGMMVATAMLMGGDATGSSWIGRCDLGEKHPVAHRRPAKLCEASELALSGAGRLVTHSDEFGVIRERDPAEGQVLGSFSLGRFTPGENSGGIALLSDGTLVLVDNAETDQSLTFDPPAE